jgi:hypothetical protein
MGPASFHHRAEVSTPNLEQIFTIGACGALAGAFVLDWYGDKLGFFIKDKYFLLVLTGALLLLALVVIRAVAVWLSVERPEHPHAHDHDRGHQHARAPWRYVVLLLPVALSLLMATEGLSEQGPAAIPVTLGQLEKAARWEKLRAEYEGRTVRLVGRCISEDNEHFTLIRFVLNEDWPDRHGVLRAALLVDVSRSREGALDARLNDKWVEVTGQAQFLKSGDGDSFVPAIVLQPTPEKRLSQLIKLVPAPANPFQD